jgi:hypothetical protein
MLMKDYVICLFSPQYILSRNHSFGGKRKFRSFGNYDAISVSNYLEILWQTYYLTTNELPKGNLQCSYYLTHVGKVTLTTNCV